MASIDRLPRALLSSINDMNEAAETPPGDRITMNISIATRHTELTPALKDHVETALDKIRDHFDKAIDANVVLSVEKRRHIAEINLHANGLRINAKDASEDMYNSVDGAVGKLDRQVLKYRDRIKRHQPRTSREARSYNLRVLDFEPYVEVEESRPGHRLVVHENVPIKPMSVDEAVLQLDLVEDLFLVFENAESGRVNVVYKRTDQRVGHIEPHE